MAGTPQTPLQMHMDGSEPDLLRQVINKLIDDLETLRAAFVAHQHAALNAAPSTNTVAAAALTGHKINSRK